MPFKFTLNRELLVRQGVSKESEQALLRTHKIKALLVEEMELTDDPALLRQLAQTIEELETCQQILWNFAPDPTKHYWWAYPKCKCPKLDNQERWGVDQRIISMDCPVHGNTSKAFPIN